MKNTAVIFLLLTLSLAAFAQKPKASKSTKPGAKTSLVAPEKPADEQAEFERATAIPNASERIAALQKFAANFPESAKKIDAQQLLVVARAQAGDEKLQAGETEGGTELFRRAVKDAPVPFSEKLFAEIILQFPTNLFWRGQQKAALEIAQMIEAKVDGNAKQTLGLATFYLGVENAAEAERLARKAIATDANLPAAYQTLGLAHRINFQLEEAANAYQKALELDPASNVSKRSLAEMKRAVGKPDEAAALYREVLTADSADAAAQTGFILALFDNGKQSEAEAELSKSLAANASNLPLLVGAAYWYAANGNGARAVELAAKAVELEPRYTWAHIALARGLTAQKRPLEAERTLITARQYGNFPTLDYEIASARFRAGFFREAAEILRQSFKVKGETVETRLGGRVTRESDNFIELLDAERRASIFQPIAADDRQTAEQLKSLLVFSRNLDAAETEEAEIARAADRFIEGNDAMRLHRQIYVAERLLQSGKALPKSLEITQTALGKTDSGLEVATPAAAVLADELYESRMLAASKNQLIVVPEVPRQTLSAILRGRIEEIAGWTLYRQNDPAQAAVRLRRAVSILPENSAWWRSSMWRLGAALQADGKEKEALDVYLKSYPREAIDSARYAIVEALYQKVNGTLEGFEARLGVQTSAPTFVTAAAETKSVETKTAQNEAGNEVRNEAKPESRSATPPNSARRIKVPDNVPLVPVTIAESAASRQIEAAKEQTSIAPTPVEIVKQQPQLELAKQPPTADVGKEIQPSTTEKKVDVADSERTAADAGQNALETRKTDADARQSPTKIQPKTADATLEAKKNDAEKANAQNAETENPTVEKALEIEKKAANQTIEPNVNNDVSKEISAARAKNFNLTPNPSVGSAAKSATDENKTLVKEPLPISAETEKIPVETPNGNDLTTKQASAPEPKNAVTNGKTLFDPIVISVPQRDKPGNSNPEAPAQAAENQIQPEKTPASSVELTKQTEKTLTGKTEDSTFTRPRVVVTDNLPPEKIAPCSIFVNQEDISLLNGGGVLGILVGYVKKGDLKQISAVSSSPDDVSVVYEPEIVAPAGQSFYVIKSISAKTGVFTITFEAPCGKKEVAVKVR